MKELTAEQYKDSVLNLLCAFDKFCREKDIKYYLAYGTALGAVRHHGFIPWDDDIDIVVFRSDYNRLISLSEECKDFRFCCYENTKDYFYNSGKIFDNKTKLVNKYMKDLEGQGAFLDVFPIEFDYSEKNKDKIHRKLNCYNVMIRLTGLKKYWPSSNFFKNFIKFPVYCFANLFGNSFWQKKHKKFIDKLNHYNGQKRFILYDTIFEYDYFGTGVEAEFENESFIIPTDYDKLLRIWYGDYMCLPKLEEQTSSHDFKCFLID